MLNSIPFIGWLIGFILYSSISVPFWYCWTVCGLGTKYFGFLPVQYQSVPFWDCVGLVFIIAILKAVIVPNFVRVPSTKNND